MSKINEDDVINFYLPLVLRECKDSYKGLEWEDRIAEGKLALLYAIRTYRIQNGNFNEYATIQIRRILKQQNTKAWSERKPDSRFSLDAPFIAFNSESKHFTLSSSTGTCLDDTLLDVKCFIDILPQYEKTIILMLMDGLKIRSISSELAISESQIHTILGSIRGKVTEYFSQDISAS